MLLLRVYVLDRPVAIPNEERYGGCKSWLNLAEPLSAEGARPALGDEAFDKALQTVRQALAGGR
ncbi:DUF1802 family protein [Cohnella ginsengisoli]|uniref:DUF1802 family protein n=1 Tax=Cohnella ginsengisoli TaxID=425004 RepID=A0A9X4KES7_9BACL|nr:DUF1802 family protein [Cohnella ginsengisoli]MDG0790269.1 DUF1802 family protein [Cohnella ginsengisoli]